MSIVHETEEPRKEWINGNDSAVRKHSRSTMCLFAMTIPDSLFLRISHFDTAREVLLYLQGLFERTTTTTTTTTVHDAQHSDTTRVAARSTNEVRNGSRRQRDDSPRNGTRRERERTMTNQGRVETRSRVAEKGAKTRGRVEEEAAAAPRGPGTVTTAKTTDGVSLATPASSPVPRDDEVVLTEEPRVKSQPPEGQLGATSQVRTPPSKDASDGEAQGATGEEAEGGEKDGDEPRRAHERVDNKDSWVETSEDETTTATPRAPQSMPLEGEWIGKARRRPRAHDARRATTQTRARTPR